jgi:hypothetical protein
MAEITAAELDGWEQHWECRKRVYEEDLDPVLRLIAEVRWLRAEVEKLSGALSTEIGQRLMREKVALCPHCGCKLAEQALENPPLHEQD